MIRTCLVCLLLVVDLCAQGRTVLAIGAHGGDMDITAGTVLARHVRA